MRRIRSSVVLWALSLVLLGCSSASDPTKAGSAPTEPAASQAAASDSDVGPAESDEQEPDPAGSAGGFSAVAAEIEAFVADRGLNGAGLIVVHRDDGVLYHDHFGEFTEDRISLIASSSKMISAGVLLRLQEDGLLDIDVPIGEQVSWAAGSSEITPAQLLSNSSGLVGLGPDFLYAPYLCQWTPSAELEDCGKTVLTGPDDDGDVADPDTEFRYGGAQWQVAGAVAEAVSGKTWEQLIDEIYVEPCGLDSLGYISLGSVVGGSGYPTVFGGDPESVEQTDNPNIEGGAYVTTGDYGELLLMHLRGGVCGDNQVLSQSSLDTMHTDRIGSTYGGNASGPNVGYGMGWWVDRETARISDGGAFGTVPWLDLDDGYGAYLVIEDTSSTGGQLADLIEDLVHEAVVG